MYKLIIIDDEPCFLESIVALFDWQLMNFELAATFTDSKKALQYLETNHVDAILTDIKMPKLSGLELARICHKTYPQIKIAFLTAYSDFEYAKAAVKYNVTDYILKATSFSELSTSIEEFLLSVIPDAAKDTNINSEDMEKFRKQQVFTNLLLGIIQSEEELQAQLISAGLEGIDFTLPCCLLTFILDDFTDYLRRWNYSRERLYLAIEQMFLSNNNKLSFTITRYAHDKLEFIVFCKNKCDNFQNVLDDSLSLFYKNTASILKLNVRLLDEKKYNSIGNLISDSELRFEDLPVNSETIITKTRQYIEQNYYKSISLNDIASHVGLSPTYFSAYYKKVTHSNYNADLNAFRIEKSKALLKKTDIKASQVFHMVGYQSYTYFYKIFKEYTGHTPASYQAKFSE